MITKATPDLPEIIWVKDQEVDRHDHCIYYGASGTSEDGRLWMGMWICVDGVFDEIEEIEEIIIP